MNRSYVIDFIRRCSNDKYLDLKKFLQTNQDRNHSINSLSRRFLVSRFVIRKKQYEEGVKRSYQCNKLVVDTKIIREISNLRKNGQ